MNVMKCVKHLIDSEYENSIAASQEELASFSDNIYHTNLPIGYR